MDQQDISNNDTCEGKEKRGITYKYNNEITRAASIDITMGIDGEDKYKGEMR